MNIKRLTIYTKNLAAQRDFYTKVLNLKTCNQAENWVSFILGKSVLRIEQRKEATPYHFAINIPANQGIEALSWLKTKVEILKYNGKELQDFPGWNAEAVYFYDKDNNIVELIARKNLKNESDSPFDQNSFLEISEIGLPTKDIKPVFNSLNTTCGLEFFDGNFERFCALGDDTGLFICVNKLVKDWFPTNDKAHSSDFSTIITEKGENFLIKFYNEKLEISK